MVFGITVSSRAIGRLAFVSLSLSSSCSRHFFTAGYKPVPKVDQTRRCIEISPPEGTEVKASLVFMHGLGDTASGWGGAMMDIATKIPGLRVYLPTASNKPVTLNGGYEMPSWYDIKSLDDDRSNDDCAGIEDSRAIVLDLLNAEKEKYGLKNNQLYVGGFSQGGAMSLYTGLQYDDPNPLGGVICMSGYLANAANWKISPAGIKTKLGMFHGKDDPVVKLIWAQNSFEKIKNEAKIEDASIKLYEGLEHSANMEELMDVVAFLQRCIKENENSPEL